MAILASNLSIIPHTNVILRYPDATRFEGFGLRVIAIGGQSFVTGFMLSGVEGYVADNPSQALQKIAEFSRRDDVGLMVLSDDISEPIRDELNTIRMKKPIPVIYELPGPNSQREPIDYKQMLKKVLGI